MDESTKELIRECNFRHTRGLVNSVIIVAELVICSMCLASWYTNDILPAFGEDNILSAIILLGAAGGCSLGSIGFLWIVNFIYLWYMHRKS